MTPLQLYHGLLQINCPISIMAPTRKRLLQGKLPNPALMKKIKEHVECQAVSPRSPVVGGKRRVVRHFNRRLLSPKTPSPTRVVARRIEPTRVVARKISHGARPGGRAQVNGTNGQRTEAMLLQNLMRRIKNRKGGYKKNNILF